MTKKNYVAATVRATLLQKTHQHQCGAAWRSVIHSFVEYTVYDYLLWTCMFTKSQKTYVVSVLSHWDSNEGACNVSSCPWVTTWLSWGAVIWSLPFIQDTRHYNTEVNKCLYFNLNHFYHLKKIKMLMLDKCHGLMTRSPKVVIVVWPADTPTHRMTLYHYRADCWGRAATPCWHCLLT